jgi:tellurite resistance protein TerC
MLFASSESSRDNFVDLDVPVWAWVALAVILTTMLAVDLYRHRDDHVPSSREALGETLAWIACGLAFSVAIAIGFGSAAFGEYISAYLIEKSLSVDNVFVWSMLFSSMAIPLKFQHRVLFWGIFGALFLRLVFILVGSALIAKFSWMLVVFGVFLIYTGFKIIRHRDDEETESGTKLVDFIRRFMPMTDEFDGHKFITVKNAKRVGTPLLAALIVIELTDVVFAFDSVPAVLAVSNEPYIVFSSNAFAIVGLRAMYFLLANARERFHYLSHALGAILIFVGAKMALSEWFHMNTYVSLCIIVSLLIGAVILSELKTRKIAAQAERSSASE